TGGSRLSPIPPSPVPAEGAQRQPALPAELAPAQAACFELRHQTLDLGPAPPAPYHAHLFFIHAPTSSSNSSQEQMGWSDAYKRLGGRLLLCQWLCALREARGVAKLFTWMMGSIISRSPCQWKMRNCRFMTFPLGTMG